MGKHIARRTLLGTGLSVSLLSGFARPSLAQSKLFPITIALSSNSLGLAPLRISVHRRLFEKNGIEAKITIMDSGNAAMTALLSGSVQMAAPGLSEALLVRARGQRIVIVANIHRGLGTSLILSKKVADKLGVGPNNPLPERLKALNGLKVALPSATSPSVSAFRGAASTGGATFESVYMAQPAMVPALETGAIDAMVAAAPAWLKPVASGSGYLWVSGPRGDIPDQYNTPSSACLQVTEDFAKANPQIVSATRKTMQDAADMILQKPADAKRALEEIYPDLKPQDIEMVFESAHKNWARPIITADDVKHEMAILKASGLGNAAVEKVDPKTLLAQ